MNLTRLVALLIIIASSTPALAQNWRRVGSTPVDLGPLHEWAKGGREGERPLQHWKELQLVELNPAKKINTMENCVVAFEDGKQIEVLIESLENAIKEPFIKFQEIEKRLTTWTRKS